MDQPNPNQHFQFSCELIFIEMLECKPGPTVTSINKILHLFEILQKKAIESSAQMNWKMFID